MWQGIFLYPGGSFPSGIFLKNLELHNLVHLLSRASFHSSFLFNTLSVSLISTFIVMQSWASLILGYQAMYLIIILLDYMSNSLSVHMYSVIWGTKILGYCLGMTSRDPLRHLCRHLMDSVWGPTLLRQYSSKTGPVCSSLRHSTLVGVIGSLSSARVHHMKTYSSTRPPKRDILIEILWCWKAVWCHSLFNKSLMCNTPASNWNVRAKNVHVVYLEIWLL